MLPLKYLNNSTRDIDILIIITITSLLLSFINIYKTFYTGANSRGIAQAKAVLFFILVAVLALGQLRFTREKEVQR